MAKKDYEEKIEELLEGSEKENEEVEVEAKLLLSCWRSWRSSSRSASSRSTAAAFL